MKRLILGKGLLGSELVKQTKWKCLYRGKSHCFDFGDIKTYRKKIHGYNEIINCIADTDTYSEKRENHWNINFKGVCDLVDECNKRKQKLIHISTSYIYSRSDSCASEEDIPVHCSTWYGYTKLLSDAYVQLRSKNYLLIRTIFKPTPFPYDLAITRQTGNFDYVDVIAKLIKVLIIGGATGVYNVGTEEKTVYHLAAKTRPNVKPLHTLLSKNTPSDVTMNLEKMKRFRRNLKK